MSEELHDYLLRNMNQELSNIVTKHMFDKYKEQFKVMSIGKRFNTGSATLYAYSIQNRTVPIKIVYAFEEQTFRDNYIERIVAREYENRILNMSAGEMTHSSVVNVLFDGIGMKLQKETDVTITIEEFEIKYNPKDIIITWIVPGETLLTEDKKVMKACLERMKKDHVFKVVVCEVYCCPEERWTDLQELYRKIPTCNKGDIWRVTGKERETLIVIE